MLFTMPLLLDFKIWEACMTHSVLSQYFQSDPTIFIKTEVKLHQKQDLFMILSSRVLTNIYFLSFPEVNIQDGRIIGRSCFFFFFCNFICPVEEKRIPLKNINLVSYWLHRSSFYNYIQWTVNKSGRLLFNLLPEIFLCITYGTNYRVKIETPVPNKEHLVR